MMYGAYMHISKCYNDVSGNERVLRQTFIVIYKKANAHLIEISDGSEKTEENVKSYSEMYALLALATQTLYTLYTDSKI